MQHEITEKHNVFEENGEVMCAGWARTPVFEYNSEQSKTSGKHSERDCYFISNTEVSLYLSVENLGMEFAVKIAVADLKRGGVIYDCVVKKFVFSKNELPESGSSGELLYTAKRLQLQLTRRAKVLTKLHRLRETENIFILNALFPNLSQAELSVLAAWNIL